MIVNNLNIILDKSCNQTTCILNVCLNKYSENNSYDTFIILILQRYFAPTKIGPNNQ